MRKITILDIIFWIAMAILILYIIAKLTGLINTPDWVNIIPLITLVFIIGAFYQRVMNFMEVIYHRTDYLKNNLDKISDKINEHENRISRIEIKKK